MSCMQKSFCKKNWTKVVFFFVAQMRDLHTKTVYGCTADDGREIWGHWGQLL